MLASCAYLPQAPEECTLAECECLPADDDQIPEEIIERDLEEFEFALDGWARWDMPSDTYYDLQEYPEMNTKYEGAFIWNFVHDKICFKGEAEWKQDFNRAVSGFHASVSAHIVRSILEDGDEERALAEYRRRLREQKGAVENLYYATMIVLNACNVASERLRGYDYVDAEVNGLMDELLQMPLCCGGCVFAAQDNLQRHASYQGGVGLWQARLRARDLNRIINCVQCSLCRCGRAPCDHSAPPARPPPACRAATARPCSPSSVRAPLPRSHPCRASAWVAGCTARWARSA